MPDRYPHIPKHGRRTTQGLRFRLLLHWEIIPPSSESRGIGKLESVDSCRGNEDAILQTNTRPDEERRCLVWFA